MTASLPSHAPVALASEDAQGPVRVSESSFEKFERDLDRRLAGLVARWAHAAAPQAARNVIRNNPLR